MLLSLMQATKGGLYLILRCVWPPQRPSDAAGRLGRLGSDPAHLRADELKTSCYDLVHSTMCYSPLES